MASDNLIVQLVRPDDLLVLDFEFVNLTVDTTVPAPRLVRAQAGQELVGRSRSSNAR
jgi:hypothetical protein